ncbi:MAG: prepilin-type N-terminal cleavage/methylation domain-containing protein [bacterium]
MNKNKNKKGFTMIELLVVILVVGILTSLAAVALNNVRLKSRDAKRLADMNILQTALEQYKMDESSYPLAITAGNALIGPNSGITYLLSVPTNPSPRTDGSCSNTDYIYTQDDSGASYHISFCLADASNELVAGNNTLVPNAMLAVDSSTCTPDCATAICGSDDGCGGNCDTCYMEVLVVAAGGGGGNGKTSGEPGGGGGGAGGLLYDSALPVTFQEYSVVIGTGASHVNGENSSFSTMVAIGGGHGGTANTSEDTGDGGSGGGGGGGNGGDTTGGTGTEGQGYAGRGWPSSGSAGGGGGGASAIATSPVGANGLAYDISGELTYYAGGGGAGRGDYTSYAGGTGGGGAGGGSANSYTGQPGTANTGGGGGGSAGYVNKAGGAGGSGIVIIRYVTANFGTCTGGAITTDGGDTIHTFTSSGTFTVAN